MHDQSNAEKTVLITGSSRGIGRAIASCLATNGYQVVLHGRSDSDALNAAVSDICSIYNQQQREADVRVLTFDLADRAQCADILQADVNENGAYYGVVLNAGVTADAAFPGLTGEQWDQVLRTNLDGFYNVLNPIMMPMIKRRKPGRIVTLTSVSGLIGNRGQTNYSAAKAGLIGASKALAIELAKRKITVNCVAPGLIESDMTAELPAADMLASIPTQRMGKPEEVASLINYLLDDAAAYITRQVIAVNGGMF